MQHIASDKLKTQSPFDSLFPVSDTVLDAVADHMREHGYDESQPIVVWDRTQDGQNLIVIDGHTRLHAARRVELPDVCVAAVKFAGEDEALEYAIHNQRNRRNLTDADLLRCIEALDRRKQQGERTDLASPDAKLASGTSRRKSAVATAKMVGTSQTKVERGRTVLAYADPETKEAVLSGKKSIQKAYTETQWQRKQQAQPEEQTPTSDAMQRAEKAIRQLESIRAGDPGRNQAFAHVAKWISDHQKENAPTDELRKDDESEGKTENAAPVLIPQYVYCKHQDMLIACTECSGCYDVNCENYPVP